VGADRPLMAEWIFQFAVAVAPEHVVERHRDFRARAPITRCGFCAAQELSRVSLNILRTAASE
jgi:hypothetical protein